MDVGEYVEKQTARSFFMVVLKATAWNFFSFAIFLQHTVPGITITPGTDFYSS